MKYLINAVCVFIAVLLANIITLFIADSYVSSKLPKVTQELITAADNHFNSKYPIVGKNLTAMEQLSKYFTELDEKLSAELQKSDYFKSNMPSEEMSKLGIETLTKFAGILFPKSSKLFQDNFVTNFAKNRKIARQKACFANMRVLLGAVEMYNMDNAVMMDKLDINKLVQGGYLKSSPAKPEAECSYNGYGLTENGEIYCTYHGSIEHPRNMD